MDEKLFTALARVAEWRGSDIDVQELANMAWALATLKWSDETLFTALERAAGQRMNELHVQELANTA